MKMKRTLLIILVIFGLSECGKLTNEENAKRLRECGKQMLKRPKPKNSQPVRMSLPKDQWIGKAFLGNLKGGSINVWWEFTVGSFLSPRHILTSSQPLIDNNTNFRWKGDSPKLFDNDTGHVKVPLKGKDNKLFSVYVTWSPSKNNHLNKDDSNTFEAAAVWILRMKDQDDIWKMRSPMIIELADNITDVDYACLVQESTVLNDKEEIDIYGYSDGTRPNVTTLDYRRRKIVGFKKNNQSGRLAQHWILVDRYFSSEDRGGPMVKQIGKKATVIGIAGSTGVTYDDDKNTTKSYFFDMRNLNKDVCDLTGICDGPPAPEVTSKATSPFKTPPGPSQTSPASIRTWTTQPPPPRPSDAATKASQKPQPENPEEIVTGEEDEEVEQYEHNYDYIVVSRDFLNGSGGVELNFLVLLVFGLWYWWI